MNSTTFLTIVGKIPMAVWFHENPKKNVEDLV
jgi:hypothetical protein